MKKPSTKLTKALIDNAIRWWQSKAPLHWSREQHLEKLYVNCTSESERNLATAVAEFIENG